MIALKNKKIKIIKLLIKQGANIYLKNNIHFNSYQNKSFSDFLQDENLKKEIYNE